MFEYPVLQHSGAETKNDNSYCFLNTFTQLQSYHHSILQPISQMDTLIDMVDLDIANSNRLICQR